MKKIIIIILCLVIATINLNQVAYGAEDLNLTSKSAVLINADDGKILFEKNCNDRLSPASITKIMLLVMACEKLDSNEIALTDEVTISAHAASMGGSQVFLEETEVQTVENLLKAICMRSANDASVALAECLFGSEEACVNQMNEKAIELNMTNTHFVNVTGLPVENHYSTACDIATMSRELLKYDYPKHHMVTWMDKMLVGKNKNIEQVLVNTNKLINRYNGLLGLKTGFTQEAKYCLSAAASRNDTTLIAVVLGCDDTKIRFNEAEQILNYGFANFKTITFHKDGDTIVQVPVQVAKNDMMDVISKEKVSVLSSSGSKESDYEINYVVEENLRAPIDADTVVGKLTVSKGGEIIKEYNLYPSQNILKDNYFCYFGKLLVKTILE